MKMYGFVHVAEAYAVRIFAMEVTLSLMLGKISLMSLSQPLQAVTGGIIRGAGKQMIGAVCNLVCFYFIGFPIGVSLMFPAKMGIVGEDQYIQIYIKWLTIRGSIHTKESSSFLLAGMWTGFLICISIQSAFFTVFLYKLNWKKATEEVSTSTVSLCLRNNLTKSISINLLLINDT